MKWEMGKEMEEGTKEREEHEWQKKGNGGFDSR